MPVIATINIDVRKIPESRLIKGKKGTYLDAALVENKNGTDEYKNDGFVRIGLSKEAREAGEQGEIIGNFRYLKQRPAARSERQEEPPRRRTRGADESGDAPW